MKKEANRIIATRFSNYRLQKVTHLYIRNRNLFKYLGSVSSTFGLDLLYELKNSSGHNWDAKIKYFLNDNTQQWIHYNDAIYRGEQIVKETAKLSTMLKWIFRNNPLILIGCL